jgi:hypothetical protein
MVMPELVALGHPIQMPSDDSESDWIYAADAAEAWWRAMVTPTPPRLVYNLAAERRRMADVTAHLRKLLPEARIGVSDKRIPNIVNMNCENLMKDLDFKPRYTIGNRPHGIRQRCSQIRRPRASQSIKQNGRGATLARFLLDVVVALGAARQHIGERLRWQAHQPYHVGASGKPSACL